MMTMDHVKAEKAKLAVVEKGLMELDKIKRINDLIEHGEFVISISRADGYVDSPVYISTLLDDREQAVLGKSVQVALEFARQRIERGIENV